MLTDFNGADRMYIACGYTDLRRGIDGLAVLVQQQFNLDPFANTLFLFCGRRRDRIKALYWEGNGFVLLYKRLESGYLEASRKEKLMQKRVTSVAQKTQPKYVEKRYSWDKYAEDDEDDEEDVHPEFVEKRYSWDKYADDDEDDDEDFDQVDDENNGLEVNEERFDVTETHSCVWIEDISRLANDLAYYIPDVSFSIIGLIEDSTDGVDDLMDFGIEYSNKKLSVRKTCLIICVQDVRVLTPHCCRHTYVSQLQALGVSIETIQSIVGHADLDMTRHYLHVQENIRLEAVDRFSEAFSRKGSGTYGNVLEYVKSS